MLLAREIWGRPEIRGCPRSPGPGPDTDQQIRASAEKRDRGLHFSSHRISFFSSYWKVARLQDNDRQEQRTFLLSERAMLVSWAIGVSMSLLHQDHIFLVPPPGGESGDREFGRPFERLSGKR